MRTLALRQHGVFARCQLLDLGLSPKAVRHRLARGRIFAIHVGIYALVPVEELTDRGRWMSAVLACGESAALSDESAASLMGVWHQESRGTEVNLPRSATRQPLGVMVHKRFLLPEDTTRIDGIPVTSANATLLALAALRPGSALERAISEADRLDLTSPVELRAYVDAVGPRSGCAALRATLDRHTFTLTDSELERRFVPIAIEAGMPRPLTRQWVNGHRVDFYWPGLGLVVETDGIRYHRDPSQQARDRLRDQAHTAAGMTQLRFTHAQVRWHPGHVCETLRRVAGRLGRNRSGSVPP